MTLINEESAGAEVNINEAYNGLYNQRSVSKKKKT